MVLEGLRSLFGMDPPGMRRASVRCVNPLGLHRVTVREIAGNRLKVGPIEAIDQTPVIDIKVALDRI